MRSTSVLLLIGFFFYLGINHFELPNFFFLQKTLKTKGSVIEVKSMIGIRGYSYEQATYEYQIGDSLYVDKFKAGQREGHQVVGDRLLIQYSVNNPTKNKVIGFYRDSKDRKKKPVSTSSKKIN